MTAAVEFVSGSREFGKSSWGWKMIECSCSFAGSAIVPADIGSPRFQTVRLERIENDSGISTSRIEHTDLGDKLTGRTG